jgi:hypothetical protein
MSNKYRLTVSGSKVIEYLEVPDDSQRRTFANLDSIEELEEYLAENELAISNDGKIVLCHLDGKLLEVAIVPRNNASTNEYIFNSKEDADHFINTQGFKPSIHLLNVDIQESVSSFFTNSDCSFEDCEELRSEYKKELEMAGGTECPDCTKNSIMRKYQDKVIDLLEEQQHKGDPEYVSSTIQAQQ